MVVQVREGMICWATGSRMASSSSGWATWLWSVLPALLLLYPGVIMIIDIIFIVVMLSIGPHIY